MELERFRLTDEEIPYIETCVDEADKIAHRAIADAATEKALRAYVALRAALEHATTVADDALAENSWLAQERDGAERRAKALHGHLGVVHGQHMEEDCSICAMLSAPTEPQEQGRGVQS